MSAARWDDLKIRMISGALMALAGMVAVFLGGWYFGALAVLAAGLMVWELAGMMGAGQAAVPLGTLAAVSLFSASMIPPGAAQLLLLAAPLAGACAIRCDRLIFAAYALAILIAAHGLYWFRLENGGVWLFWLILVVIASDVGGYFAGRLIGGPKFWPRVSPKKTWSGTIAGWIGAAIVGAVFISFTTAGIDLIWISALVALASQLGDITESAIKRRKGVKDSSRLIPGHGGLLDRFDGLLGAALMMLLVALFVTVPSVRI
ncbi:phosphatidate cytidylyltransferase [Defluviimonas sp. 20V17]|uniref:Phosphatidate cytidylyltransferase n=1 Tax=Allgaiera indica TaxID=765699 RepID=A0AAN4UQZ9_9RHOB|nr:phosphatidate cytidylyltransferase [Allgaiera indica]KDB02864.1 phosphatidate cytidylyltransferase [Defluviimonas sp. 20V17]GHE01338.1 phosphatidate cytidylyltransferase [Allgaiera indica]SDW84983.1 phosphatidate cytidylyltransferase [Allgaiera indica]